MISKVVPPVGIILCIEQHEDNYPYSHRTFYKDWWLPSQPCAMFGVVNSDVSHFSGHLRVYETLVRPGRNPVCQIGLDQVSLTVSILCRLKFAEIGEKFIFKLLYAWLKLDFICQLHWSILNQRTLTVLWELWHSVIDTDRTDGLLWSARTSTNLVKVFWLINTVSCEHLNIDVFKLCLQIIFFPLYYIILWLVKGMNYGRALILSDCQ